MIDFTLGAALALFFLSLPVSSTEGGRLLRKAAAFLGFIGGALFLLRWGLFELLVALRNFHIGRGLPAIFALFVLSLLAYAVLRVRRFFRERQGGRERLSIPNPRSIGKDWSRPENPSRDR